MNPVIAFCIDSLSRRQISRLVLWICCGRIPCRLIRTKNTPVRCPLACLYTECDLLLSPSWYYVRTGWLFFFQTKLNSLLKKKWCTSSQSSYQRSVCVLPALPLSSITLSPPQ